MALIPASLTLPGFQGEGLGRDTRRLVWKQHSLRSPPSPLSALLPEGHSFFWTFVKISARGGFYADYQGRALVPKPIREAGTAAGGKRRSTLPHLEDVFLVYLLLLVGLFFLKHVLRLE